MWLVRLRTSATASNPVKHPQLGRALGAYVNCFVSFHDPEGAVHLAKFYATATREWRVTRVIGCGPITRRDLRGDPDHLRYFKEAETDGYSLVFHIYPRDPKLARRSAMAAATM